MSSDRKIRWLSWYGMSNWSATRGLGLLCGAVLVLGLPSAAGRAALPKWHEGSLAFSTATPSAVTIPAPTEDGRDIDPGMVILSPFNGDPNMAVGVPFNEPGVVAVPGPAQPSEQQERKDIVPQGPASDIVLSLR